ncbi:MAG TPA: hypothetical protein VGJ00_10540 [Rhabdochlamydiaceae bacterium]|jgi:hypothetical protein
MSTSPTQVQGGKKPVDFIDGLAIQVHSIAQMVKEQPLAIIQSQLTQGAIKNWQHALREEAASTTPEGQRIVQSKPLLELFKLASLDLSLSPTSVPSTLDLCATQIINNEEGASKIFDTIDPSIQGRVFTLIGEGFYRGQPGKAQDIQRFGQMVFNHVCKTGKDSLDPIKHKQFIDKGAQLNTLCAHAVVTIAQEIPDTLWDKVQQAFSEPVSSSFSKPLTHSRVTDISDVRPPSSSSTSSSSLIPSISTKKQEMQQQAALLAERAKQNTNKPSAQIPAPSKDRSGELRVANEKLEKAKKALVDLGKSFQGHTSALDKIAGDLLGYRSKLIEAGKKAQQYAALSKDLTAKVENLDLEPSSYETQENEVAALRAQVIADRKNEKGIKDNIASLESQQKFHDEQVKFLEGQIKSQKEVVQQLQEAFAILKSSVETNKSKHSQQRSQAPSNQSGGTSSSKTSLPPPPSTTKTSISMDQAFEGQDSFYTSAPSAFSSSFGTPSSLGTFEGFVTSSTEEPFGGFETPASQVSFGGFPTLPKQPSKVALLPSSFASPYQGGGTNLDPFSSSSGFSFNSSTPSFGTPSYPSTSESFAFGDDTSVPSVTQQDSFSVEQEEAEFDTDAAKTNLQKLIEQCAIRTTDKVRTVAMFKIYQDLPESVQEMFTQALTVGGSKKEEWLSKNFGANSTLIKVQQALISVKEML